MRLQKQETLPSFLVIGTQKGGTTSLQKLMECHPEIFLPACKEVHYFTLHPEKPINWYKAHFKGASAQQLIGDITPYYMFHPDAAKRIKFLLPKVRLIALLRDPVERTLSQYFHAKRNGFESLDIKKALEAESSRLGSGSSYSHQKHSYLSRSRYLEQLERYESLFQKDKILILRSEDLFMQTQIVWEKIQKFLGVKVQTLTSPLPRANSGLNEASSVSPIIREHLRNELKSTVLGIKNRYGFDWGW